MANIKDVLGYLKRPFEMGSWSWEAKSPTAEDAKEENGNSVSSSKRSSALSRNKNVRSTRTTVLSNNPKVPPWEVVFDQHLKQCLRAAKLRDFTYFRLSAALSSKPELNDLNHRGSLLAIIRDDTSIRKLEGLNKAICEVIANGFRDYVKGIGGAKDEQLDWLAWGRLLDSEEERLIEAITNKIKATFEEAKEIIRGLPLDAAGLAASIWVEGSGFAMSAFRTSCSHTNIISGRVGEFEKGEFGILKEAEEKVIDASKAAELAISGQPRETGLDSLGDGL